ncbi:MAG: PIN domain-containing protein, partial [Terriglobales bacterium]
YAYQNTDSRKQPVARDLLRKAIAGECVISTQVLSEFAATLLHKFSTPPNAEELAEILDRLEPIKLVLSDMQIIRRAVQAQRSYQLHFYDSLIVAAAERAGCARILSEDFNEGQKYFGVTAANPFK